MRLLALDPGQTVGFAEVVCKAQPHLTRWGQYTLIGTEWDALWRFLYSIQRPDVVVVEGPLMAYSTRTRVELHEVRGVIRCWAQTSDISIVLYHPSTVKASATGIAGATKRQVMTSMSAMWGVEHWDTDHASDAVAIATTHLIKTGVISKGAKLSHAPLGGGTKPVRGKRRSK